MSTFYYVNTPDEVKLESLLRHVMPTINNLPYELGLELVRQAFTEFARKTQMLASQQYLDFQRGVVDYEITAPTGYFTHMVREVGSGSNTIVGSITPHSWYVCGRYRFSVIGNNVLMLSAAPSTDEAGAFAVLTTVIPNESIVTIPREVSVAYGKCIADGALAEALLIKSKPWYDPNLAQQKKRDFYRGVQSAGALALMNRTSGTMTARTPRWV